jgi:cysteine synthase A
MPDPWLSAAIATINADFTRSADTHLIAVPLPLPNLRLYIKDESTHITGSLKHRLARSLFLYALCNGWIRRDTPIIEASSGSTAISEAYYARLLGLRFLAVIARGTSPEKIQRIERYGGECVFVDDPRDDRGRAQALAQELDGYFMDQFTFAERATDWRGNNNIAESIFAQMADEPFPCPRWIICGAGTGGTAATLGRYVRYRSYETSICVVDPERSAYYAYYRTGRYAPCPPGGSGIEGIGRPQVEPSFLPTVIDRMIQVPNTASYAAIHVLEEVIGKRFGGSTGTNLVGAITLLHEMQLAGEAGSVVMVGCDSGELYRDTYYHADWLRSQHIDIAPYRTWFHTFLTSGAWQPIA